MDQQESLRLQGREFLQAEKHQEWKYFREQALSPAYC